MPEDEIQLIETPEKKPRKRKAAANADEAVNTVPPWPNANIKEPIADGATAKSEPKPPANARRYYCLANCGNGKYIKGRIYLLSPDLPIVGKPKYFREA